MRWRGEGERGGEGEDAVVQLLCYGFCVERVHVAAMPPKVRGGKGGGEEYIASFHGLFPRAMHHENIQVFMK